MVVCSEEETAMSSFGRNGTPVVCLTGWGHSRFDKINEQGKSRVAIRAFHIIAKPLLELEDVNCEDEWHHATKFLWQVRIHACMHACMLICMYACNMCWIIVGTREMGGFCS